MVATHWRRGGRAIDFADAQSVKWAFGKPDADIFKLDPDLLKSVPRPE